MWTLCTGSYFQQHIQIRILTLMSNCIVDLFTLGTLYFGRMCLSRQPMESRLLILSLPKFRKHTKPVLIESQLNVSGQEFKYNYYVWFFGFLCCRGDYTLATLPNTPIDQYEIYAGTFICGRHCIQNIIIYLSFTWISIINIKSSLLWSK